MTSSVEGRRGIMSAMTLYSRGGRGSNLNMMSLLFSTAIKFLTTFFNRCAYNIADWLRSPWQTENTVFDSLIFNKIWGSFLEEE